VTAADHVDDQGEDVLSGVDALDRVRQQDPHDADQHDALGGGEVSAVDTGQVGADDQQHHPGAGDVIVGVAGFFGSSPGPGLYSGLRDHQDQREHQQHRDDLLEGGFRQRTVCGGCPANPLRSSRIEPFCR
jgi:hypothetical protein